ncbi:MAG: DNA polymerase III, subunit gamma and tau [Alphaproteobacteria bacterium]|nr:MAG: DNA polymerase III, subunit gamma and tau [Alphaproteobacteria bacterium]
MTDTYTSFRPSALKYRPQKLDDIIGQEVLVKALTNSIQNDRLAPAYVFTGVRGVGKTSTARLLARGLNCLGKDGTSGPTGSPCGVCRPCLDIIQEKSLDVLEVDAASQTGVDDVRQLIENVSYKPVHGRYKIYIIDEVHMLSKSAFNALLKTLEEPPAYAKFFLATTEIDKVPVTILSRSQRFDLKRVSVRRLQEYLGQIVEAEGRVAEAEGLRLIAEAAEGSVRDGLSILDQVFNIAEGDIMRSDVEKMLGYARQQDVIDLMTGAFAGDIQGSLDIFHKLYNEGISILMLTNRMLHCIHRLSTAKAMQAEGGLLETEKKLLEKLSIPSLTRAWQLILKGIEEIRLSPNEADAMEMILIRFCYVSHLPDLIDIATQGLDSDQKKKSFDHPVTVSESNNLQENKSRAAEKYPRDVSQTLNSGEASKENRVSEITMEQLVQYAHENNEVILATHLECSVAFIEGKNLFLKLKKVQSVPQGFERDLQKKMTAWFCAPWVVEWAADDKALSLQESKEQAQKKRLKDYQKSDTFVKIKAAFPEARLTKISERIDP